MNILGGGPAAAGALEWMRLYPRIAKLVDPFDILQVSVRHLC